MPRAAITREDVFKAAHELSIARQKITLDKLQEILKKGSRPTINKYLKEWRAQESGNELEVEIDSPSIPYIYMERLEKEKLELEKEVDGLVGANEKLISELHKQKIQTKSLQEETESLKNKCIELEQNLLLKDERLKNFEKLVAELKAQHEIAVDKILKETGARISDLMHELKDTIIGSEKETRELSTELNDRILTERAKMQNLEIALGQKEKKIKQLESRAVDEDLRKKIKRLSDENASLIGRLASAGVL
jgi:chromosome segregation ATPase